MNLVVLSGKGGTGKTTVSTNLAIALRAGYFDCDVEEPNGFIFLKPDVSSSESVEVEYPIFDTSICTMCGKCASACKFNALARTKKQIMLFEKLCHGCGACEIACPVGAISYGLRETGRVEFGSGHGVECSRGILNVGEPMAVPVIKKLLKNMTDSGNVLDASPGTSCNAVNTLRFGDAALLVTEPSAFGLHDLEMAVELVEKLGLPFGIVINKDDGHDNRIRRFAAEKGITVMGSIPYDRDIAVRYSKGEILYDVPAHRKAFDNIASSVREVFGWR